MNAYGLFHPKLTPGTVNIHEWHLFNDIHLIKINFLCILMCTICSIGGGCKKTEFEVSKIIYLPDFFNFAFSNQLLNK